MRLFSPAFLSRILHTIFLITLISADPQPKYSKTPNSKDPEFVPLNRDLSRKVLDWVAMQQQAKYETSMRERASHYSSARKIVESNPLWPYGSSIEDLSLFKEHRKAGKETFGAAENAAKVNRALASVIKGVKTTHKPRHNDFRRWGYQPAFYDLKFKMPKVGGAFLTERVKDPSYGRISRTYTPSPAVMQWITAMSMAKTQEEKNSIPSPGPELAGEIKKLDRMHELEHIRTLRDVQFDKRIQDVQPESSRSSLGTLSEGRESVKTQESEKGEQSKANQSPRAGQARCGMRLGRWVCGLPRRVGKGGKRERGDKEG